MRRSAIVAASVILTAAACTAPPSKQGGSPSPTFERGGTLRAAMQGFAAALDPQKAYQGGAWEVFRCCLLRTLLSYGGNGPEADTSALRPDLATSMPTVSEDGLTWTFHLKPGMRYAPPLGDTEIVAEDVIRALEREARPEVASGAPTAADGYPFYYSVIRGFEDYRAGRASTIAGLEAPDEHTLAVRLTEPIGDLPFRFSLPATAPIPANPSRPGDGLGVAEGHDDGYGRFLVASGPYMLEGAALLDFSSPANRQRPAAGNAPVPVVNGIPARAERVALVRNPSWDPSTDDLRKAYVDRITLFGPPPLFFRPDAGPPEYLRAFEAAARQVDRGRFDMFFDIEPPPDQVDRYRSRVTLSNRVDEVSRGSVVYLSINLALPPFDDLHVRKAVNAVIDRERLAALWNAAGYGGEATSHIAPDVTEGGLLAGWPGASSPAGDLAVARAEMRLAPRYDTDGDGLCDVAACRSVPALFSRFSALAGTVPGEMPWPPMAAAVGQELRRIGIELDLQGVGLSRLFFAPGDPESHTAIVINLWWAMDYPNASTFFAVQFPGDCIGQDQPCFNPSLVGATSGQLRRWGYGVRHVPNVDDRIRACLPLVGDAQLECWARLDQYLMEEVVPRVPYLSQTNRRVWSDRIARFAWNSYTTLPALDQIALTREAIAGSSPS